MKITTHTTEDGRRVTIPESEHGCPECHGQGKAMLEALRLAVRYLENPEVQAIPFAMSAEVPVNRIRAILRAMEEG